MARRSRGIHRAQDHHLDGLAMRPGSMWPRVRRRPWREGRQPQPVRIIGLRIEALVAIAAVLGLTAFVVLKLVSPKPSGALGASFRILVTPREPLSMRACVGEARRVGDYGVVA